MTGVQTCALPIYIKEGRVEVKFVLVKETPGSVQRRFEQRGFEIREKQECAVPRLVMKGKKAYMSGFVAQKPVDGEEEIGRAHV